MKPPTWHAELAWTTSTPMTENTMFDIMDDLTTHAPAGSIAPDGLSGSLTIALDAATLDSAISHALTTTRAALTAHALTATVTSIIVRDAEAFQRELDRPLFPEVVGYAEIADMAGVSRQRARQFRQIAGFPTPVIETAQGPLMAKAAVESWLEQRNTRPGRRKLVHA